MKGAWPGSRDHFYNFTPREISSGCLKLQSSNFVHGLATRSTNFYITNSPPNGSGYGHVTVLYLGQISVIISKTVQDRDIFQWKTGQHLKPNPYPVYLGVTSDRTLSYREHLTCTAAKLQSRNSLIAKLAGTSWGASASTLAHQPWLFAIPSQNTAAQCGLDPATQISSIPNYIAQCA